ncbi:efflux RND transporter periplasmic adaptor subunit [Aquamicrobium zhengzhouense]|uniref:Efflux RND transporter periplasmic adaptor subunit n=1 Tax=Aquamicrobium zhengzhouense TaxID=2781738 RepID=A0ABS0S8R2_9HYPH|nr:efflux RND transporter periplasmic adaptor subunit [Aquamicrobium zhengzhouense]MBI1619662.1 efflux RND transporter periplasmic adaptor subunit [Aquamicrobium zhengzhouense]
MSFWKQLASALIILAVAAGLWVKFFPGSNEVLARWGLDWIVPDPAVATSAPSGTPGPAGGFGQPALVIASQIETSTINDRLVAIGTGKALNSVSVTPFSSGRLTEFLVQSGSQVEAGDVIARLDSEVEEIAVERARLALDDAEARLNRVRSLRSSNTATAVQVTDAERDVNNARLALQDAEVTLRRRSITAPISGTVGILPVSAGNYVATQTVIATIEDRSQLVVDFWVPERFAGMISIGQSVTASSLARAGEAYEGTISALDNQVDPQSRTLHVQARLPNEEDRLSAGMSFEVSMRFPGDTYPSVDPLAIQWGTEGAFIWVLDDERKAKRVNVKIVQRNTENVLITGDIGEAERVVTQGIHSVREGATVRIVGDPQESRPQAALSTTNS